MIGKRVHFRYQNSTKKRKEDSFKERHRTRKAIKDKDFLQGWITKQNVRRLRRNLNGAETSCRVAHNLGILLMNSDCFAIFFLAAF